MKKLFVSYSNCQGAGVVHFLKQSSISSLYDFHHYNNYQILLGEQSPEDLMSDSKRADVFFYQTTPALKYGMLSTEEMVQSVVPSSSLKLAFGYGFNHGFFPLVHHGQWQTGETVKLRAQTEPEKLLFDYDQGHVNFDCRGRFESCLQEQIRREVAEKASADSVGAVFIPMSDVIQSLHQTTQLFLCENHPSSGYLAALASRVITALTNEPVTLSHATNNEANLPCGLLISPCVVRELELQYEPEIGAHAFFRGYLSRLIDSLKVG